MTVQSTSLDNGEPTRRPRKASALISGDAIDRAVPLWQRAGSIALIVISYVSTIAAFHGGWSAILALQIRPAPVLFGIAVQTWCLIFELANRRNKRSLWYMQALVLDVVPTFIGMLPVYTSLVLLLLGLVGLVDNLASMTVAGYTVLHLVIWICGLALSVCIAWLPENRLID